MSAVYPLGVVALGASAAIGIGLWPGTVAAPTTFPAVGPEHPRLVVLGIDGMDPEILAGVIERHPERAQNLQWLVDQSGGIHSLRTANPPQSPVAWTNFITGRDPGGHGIYDFIHRDPDTRGMAGSTTRSGPGKLFGLIPGAEESNRSGRTFWEVLADHGVPADIWRMPINFPVAEAEGWSFPGMMTPAVDSSYGEASLFTTDPFVRASVPAGTDEKVIDDLVEIDGVIETYVLGPVKSDGERARADLTIYLDDAGEGAVLDTGTKVLPLRVGEWSDFAQVSFKMSLTESRAGVVRFYLRSLEPNFEMYASPVNIDPTAPMAPVSAPDSASEELADAIGIYYTQGMAEDVGAFKDRLLEPNEFLDQANLVYTERRRMLEFALDRYLAKPEGGLLFFYFSTVDLMSHMMWRFADEEHPDFAEDWKDRSTEWWSGREGSQFGQILDDIYLRVDPVIGEIRARLDEALEPWTLILMSDHGFAPYRREASLNTWLLEKGYLVLRDDYLAEEGSLEREPKPRLVPLAEQVKIWTPGVVDWERTRAYGMGFNGLYLNLVGREGDDPRTKDVVEGGIVTADEAPALLAELKRELEAWIDPESNLRIVERAAIASEEYQSSERLDEAPDILVGFASGYGNSDAASQGRIPMNTVQDNLGWTFNGSHLMAPEEVSGILLSTVPPLEGEHGLEDLTVEVLAHYGIDPIDGMIGSRVLPGTP